MDTSDLLSFVRPVSRDVFLKRVEKLHQLLVEGNKRCNLTRIVERDEFISKHVFDSLLISTVIREISTTEMLIADIGCGAGFPSLVLASAFPQIRIVAIDSTKKKIDFVRETANALQLDNLTAVHGRANELNRMMEYRGRYDIVTARAVASSESISNDTGNFLKATGLYCFYKTPQQASEEIQVLGKDRRHHWRITDTISTVYGDRCFVIGAKATPAHMA